MKGTVFVEFLEMVEDRFGPEVTERMIAEAELPNGGAYTAVGTYDHSEMLRMVSALSKAAGVPVPVLVHAYGEHLFARFAVNYRWMIEGSPSALDFLAGIEDRIHKEVLKLYPEAELPRFECSFLRPGCLEVIYKSKRPFADLAEGLIDGCARHFQENIQIHREDLAAPSGFASKFILTTL